MARFVLESLVFDSTWSDSSTPRESYDHRPIIKPVYQELSLSPAETIELMLNTNEGFDSLFVFSDTQDRHATIDIGNLCGNLRSLSRYGTRYIPATSGIPLGYDETTMFEELSDEGVKDVIDDGLDEIRDLISAHSYRRIVFVAMPSLRGSEKPCYCHNDMADESINEYIACELYKMGPYGGDPEDD